MSNIHNNQKDNPFIEARKQTEEYKRLQENPQDKKANWKKWGPYLSDRQWSTIREHYGYEDRAWGYFGYDEARHRTYRWGEDGIFGISDNKQRLCFALALWNGKDNHIKERFFGLPGMWGEHTGNHMEDVKEYYFYLNNTPTHSYMKALYKYPYEYPYEDLIKENDSRNKDRPEYELIDTGCFDDGYFDVIVEYAKGNSEDILIKITVHNRGSEPHELHILPTLWFRNTWSWGKPNQKKPCLTIPETPDSEFIKVEANYKDKNFNNMWLYCESPQDAVIDTLFTENEPYENSSPDQKYIGKKDCISKYILGEITEIDKKTGTKFASHTNYQIEPGESKIIRLRLTNKGDLKKPFNDSNFESVVDERKEEADKFYKAVTPFSMSEEYRNIQQQAFAGMLWSKQFYHYVVRDWLKGDSLHYLHTIYPKFKHELEQRKGINSKWEHLHNEDIISMPDKWEYPYYCVWDSAFHAVTFALIDPDFAKEQLLLFTQENYMHPDGQIPGCEFNFDDTNPPVLAWAALKVYEIKRTIYGAEPEDLEFLGTIFDNLAQNFEWWQTKKIEVIEGEKRKKQNLYCAGFLGLDNISIIDRNQFQEDKVKIEEIDATSWMAMFSLNMLKIAIELVENEVKESNGIYQNKKIYQDISEIYFKEFLKIVREINETVDKNRRSLWYADDDFYYEVLKINLPKFSLELPLKYRSILGIIPLFAVEIFNQKDTNNYLIRHLKGKFEDIIDKVVEDEVKIKYGEELQNKDIKEKEKEYRESYDCLIGQEESIYIPRKDSNSKASIFLSIVNKRKLQNILEKVFSNDEFLSEYGIRSLSKYHEEHPYQLDGLVRNKYNQHLPIEIKYEPGHTKAPIHTGNSNWRGPIWFPLNFLLIDSLNKFNEYFKKPLEEEDFRVLFPSVSHKKITLKDASVELSKRLINIFVEKSGNRPVYGNNPQLKELFKDPEGQDLILFYEHFHGDTGQGLGASHQTGWTGLVANLIYQVVEYEYDNHIKKKSH
ncbi:MAG: glucosidase [Waterburya sp.]